MCREHALRAAQQIHLPEQLLDPGPNLLALAPQIVQLLPDGSRSAMADANCDSSADFSARKLVTSSTARVMRSSR